MTTKSDKRANEHKNSYSYREGYQTQTRGSNNSEYEIYVSCVEGTGQRVKTFEEWINS